MHTLTAPQKKILDVFCEQWEIKANYHYKAIHLEGQECVAFVLSKFVSPFALGMKLGAELAYHQECSPMGEAMQIVSMIDAMEIVSTIKVHLWDGHLLCFPNLQCSKNTP